MHSDARLMIAALRARPWARWPVCRRSISRRRRTGPCRCRRTYGLRRQRTRPAHRRLTGRQRSRPLGRPSGCAACTWLSRTRAGRPAQISSRRLRRLRRRHRRPHQNRPARRCRRCLTGSRILDAQPQCRRHHAAGRRRHHGPRSRRRRWSNRLAHCRCG